MWRHNEWVTSFLHFLKTISIYTFFFFEDVKYMYFLTSASACRITAWEHPEPRKFTSHHQHPALLFFFFPRCRFSPSFLPFLVPQGSRERARVRNCVGMAVCMIEGVGPLGASGELHEFVMSAMLAMAYWTREEQRCLREKETDRERSRPGPARLCSRCYGPKPALNRPADSQRPSQIHPWELEADLLLFLADRIDLCCIFYYKNE